MAKEPTSLVPRQVETDVAPALLEFQSPSAAVLAMPAPRSARSVIYLVTGLVASLLILAGVVRVDRVVTASGRVISQSPTLVVQPLDTSIVRSIDVTEGQVVRAGQVLARLDPTFAAADLGQLAAQVASYQAEVAREQAEVNGQPFTYSGTDKDLAAQAAVFALRQAEYSYKMENYQQKLNGLASTIAKSLADATSYQKRLEGAQQVEKMRTELERLQVGSRLNTLGATDTREEMQRNLNTAIADGNTAKRDFAALIAERDGFVNTWKADIADKLSEATRKLSDARELLNKAQLRRQLVELRADKDATVLTIAKVSVGSVLQSGDQFITLVPLDAPLEVEANIQGNEFGFVHLGDPVGIKFDTFQFSLYGLAYGKVRWISDDSFTSADDQGRAGRTGAVPIPQGSTEPFYRARITMDDIKLHNVPKGFVLTPGMPVTADIKVGERTILGYLLGRILPVAQTGMREP